MGRCVSPHLGLTGILHIAAPWGSMLKFMSIPVLNGFEFRASRLVAPWRLGTQLLPACIAPFLMAGTDFNFCGS